MNQYEQYKMFYRAIRKSAMYGADYHQFAVMADLASELGMGTAYDNARESYYARNRQPRPLAERLARYKSRKFVNSSMAYAA